MEAGPRIGSYVVREILGQGGMGTVYLAEHTVIGKKVAIKVLKRDLAGHDTLVARFINEARANAVVGHPGIVDVFDVGTLPSGVPYLVMEYLQGESLAQRIAKVRKLPVRQAANIAWETASAVGAAHAKGIVHRDLKPENLFLARDPSAPEVEKVKVLDFGIAKLHANPNQVNTQTGAVMGTPVYMSPEQCRGARDEVDHRTDIYSLGIILYEMLCGKPPFQGEAFGDLLLRHMTEAPPPMGPLNPEVPEFMEAVVMRALAKRREDRFSTMRELQKGLEGATDGRTDKTPAPFDVRRLQRTLTPPIIARTPVNASDLSPRRRNWMVAAGVAVALGIGALAIKARRPPRRLSRAVPAPAVAPRVEPLPAAAPPDAAPAVTSPPPEATTARPPVRGPATPSGKKRSQKEKIDVKQW